MFISKSSNFKYFNFKPIRHKVHSAFDQSSKLFKMFLKGKYDVQKCSVANFFDVVVRPLLNFSEACSLPKDAVL